MSNIKGRGRGGFVAMPTTEVRGWSNMGRGTRWVGLREGWGKGWSLGIERWVGATSVCPIYWLSIVLNREYEYV